MLVFAGEKSANFAINHYCTYAKGFVLKGVGTLHDFTNIIHVNAPKSFLLFPGDTLLLALCVMQQPGGRYGGGSMGPRPLRGPPESGPPRGGPPGPARGPPSGPPTSENMAGLTPQDQEKVRQHSLIHTLSRSFTPFLLALVHAFHLIVRTHTHTHTLSLSLSRSLARSHTLTHAGCSDYASTESE